ncbi:hypothetical protein HC256_005837 [Beauveria bassiana]|nr:hypothetical protein HC256_005837 [Beauveria bassiana]
MPRISSKIPLQANQLAIHLCSYLSQLQRTVHRTAPGPTRLQRPHAFCLTSNAILSAQLGLAKRNRDRRVAILMMQTRNAITASLSLPLLPIGQTLHNRAALATRSESFSSILDLLAVSQIATPLS